MAGTGEITLLSTSRKYCELFHDRLTHGLNPSAFISISKQNTSVLSLAKCKLASQG